MFFIINTNTELLSEIVKTSLWFIIPIAVLGTILLLIRIFLKIPDFIFRKILHIIAISMIIPLIIIPIHWWIAEIIMGVFALVIVVCILTLEHLTIYQKYFVEKSKHEVLFSFLIFTVIVLSFIAFFWGYRGESHKHYVLIALFSWGLGDAAASIFGHLIGKHKISGKFIEGTKSIEGSIACFIFSFLISFILLATLIHYTWWLSLIEATLIGVFVSFAELFTKKGLDNLTCPFVAAIILFLFSLI